MAAGGLAFLIGRELLALQRFAKPLLWSGFALWGIAFVLLDSSYAWPSGWALLPVLGTVLIILANQSQAKLTVNSVAQWLGDRSYSLYLWHWPLVVALYFAGLQNDWLWVSGAIALSLVLAHLSYHLVEVPTRSYLSASSLRKEIFAIALAGLVIGLAAVSVRLFTFDNRLPPSVEIAAAEANNKNPMQTECYSVSSKTNVPIDCQSSSMVVGAYLVGDSHADSAFSGVAKAANSFQYSVMYWAKAACPTLKNAKFNSFETNQGCYEFNEQVFSKLEVRKDHKPVILFSRLTRAVQNGNEEPVELQGRTRIFFDKEIKFGNDPLFQEQFRNSMVITACMLTGQRPVYLVRPIPEMGVNVPKTLARNLMFGLKDDIKITLEEYHQRHQFVWAAQDKAAEQCGVKILDPLPYLCNDQYCYGSKNGRPLYYDDDHLSEYGNKYLVPMFEQVFRDQLAKD